MPTTVPVLTLPFLPAPGPRPGSVARHRRGQVALDVDVGVVGDVEDDLD